MSRVIQPKATKGSQYWLQVLVNEQPERFNAPVREALGLDPTWPTCSWPLRQCNVRKADTVRPVEESPLETGYFAYPRYGTRR